MLRTPEAKWQLPAEMLKIVDSEMEQVGNRDLFNSPKFQKLREKWCAAKFGTAYSAVVEPCLVAINESNHRIDANFFLKIGSAEYPFQICEAMPPDRRRGDEYKKNRNEGFSDATQKAQRGGAEGPEWIASQVGKKASKRYASAHQLNLLVYANFSATRLEVNRVRMAVAQYRSTFASIWVLNDLLLVSVSIGNDLRPVEHWIGQGKSIAAALWPEATDPT